MPLYRMKPVVVDAVRYGHPVDGRWQSDSVAVVARFLLGVPADAPVLHADHFADVVRPAMAWDPPEHADLLMNDGRGRWLPLELGAWAVKGQHGRFFPCSNPVFTSTYEPVGGPYLDCDEVRRERAELAPLLDGGVEG